MPISRIGTDGIENGAVAPADLSTGGPSWDGSGNVGLQVTPSAWASSSQALQNQAGSLFTVGTGSLRLFQNAYYNSSALNVYVNTAAASGYIQAAGSHQWFYAPSGTAGNTATFIQAMTLSAAGGLSIGTTTDAGAGNIRVNGGALIGDGTAAAPTFTFYNESNVGMFRAAAGALGFTTGGTERARIDSAGIFRLSATGQNSSTAYFYQTSPAFTSGSSSKISYYSDSGTRNFGIGFLSDINGSQAAWMNAGSTDLGWVVQTNAANGVRLANTATSWSSYSDERLKNIIEEIPQALSKVSSIRAVRFSWKDDESNAPRVGVIAQDVQAVLPEVVDDDTDYMQVRYSELVPLCIKAIQEQQAMIDELKAKVAALEAK